MEGLLDSMNVRSVSLSLVPLLKGLIALITVYGNLFAMIRQHYRRDLLDSILLTELRSHHKIWRLVGLLLCYKYEHAHLTLVSGGGDHSGLSRGAVSQYLLSHLLGRTPGRGGSSGRYGCPRPACR